MMRAWRHWGQLKNGYSLEAPCPWPLQKCRFSRVRASNDAKEAGKHRF